MGRPLHTEGTLRWYPLGDDFKDNANELDELWEACVWGTGRGTFRPREKHVQRP